MFTKTALHRDRFRDISQRRGSTMRVDIINLSGVHARISQRVRHTARGALPVFAGSSHMVSVRAHAETSQLGINFGIAPPGMLQLLQYQNPRPLAQHETIPAFIPWPAGSSRIIIASG